MATTHRTGEKRTAVEHLEYTPRTLKRVEWESWEFTVVGPHLIEVTNASYGFEKDDHSYTVGIEVRDGVAVPAECECPADVHHDSDCKHKTALAIVGGPTVLNAAVTSRVQARFSTSLPTAAASVTVTDCRALTASSPAGANSLNRR